MLAYYDLSDQMDALKHWYDGYYYSGREVYNPWSLLNAIRGLVNDEGTEAIQSYWVRTSGNAIIDEMIDNNPDHRQKLANIMNGEPLWAPIIQDLSYRDLKKHSDAIWSFLLYTGYLKSIEMRQMDTGNWEALMTIPNMEIRSVMNQAMAHWWKDTFLASYPVDMLAEALWNENTSGVEEELNDILMDSVSVFDYHENFYYGMLLGLLLRTSFNRVLSNREYGEGRPDIVAYGNLRALALEIKCVKQKQIDDGMKSNPHADEEDIIESKMIAELDRAKHQIDRRRYVKGVKLAFPNAKEIKVYILCFCRKRCMARFVAE